MCFLQILKNILDNLFCFKRKALPIVNLWQRADTHVHFEWVKAQIKLMPSKSSSKQILLYLQLSSYLGRLEAI